MGIIETTFLVFCLLLNGRSLIAVLPTLGWGMLISYGTWAVVRWILAPFEKAALVTTLVCLTSTAVIYLHCGLIATLACCGSWILTQTAVLPAQFTTAILPGLLALSLPNAPFGLLWLFHPIGHLCFQSIITVTLPPNLTALTGLPTPLGLVRVLHLMSGHGGIASRPAVKVHGLDFNDSQWIVGRILLPRLLQSTERRIHTSAINLHGGGWLENDHQPDETVNDYMFILHDHLRSLKGNAKLDNIVLIGHSLGGLICEDYCRSRRCHMLAHDRNSDPVPIAGVICICSPFDGAKVVSLIPPELRHDVHLSLHRKHSKLLRDIHNDHKRGGSKLEMPRPTRPVPPWMAAKNPPKSPQKVERSTAALLLVWIRHLVCTAIWGGDWKGDPPPIPGEDKLAELSLPLTSTEMSEEAIKMRTDPVTGLTPHNGFPDGLAMSFHRMHMHAVWDAFSGTRLRNIVEPSADKATLISGPVPLKTEVTASSTGKDDEDGDSICSGSSTPRIPPRHFSTFSDVCLWHCGHYSAVVSSTAWIHIAEFIRIRIIEGKGCVVYTKGCQHFYGY
ncbi:hypothetical protein FOL47_003305 [Perkinsus chesapeaki]|uniref:AB hydrolase-1 domain-containing protein n=1 Tax=Perkinsus chesapeaki TaxID=330153 RepID=A0A7J6N0J8_PERCH|nr:hypothetical protein FOL47_003305 [Perkinsus chesapeaki]